MPNTYFGDVLSDSEDNIENVFAQLDQMNEEPKLAYALTANEPLEVITMSADRPKIVLSEDE